MRAFALTTAAVAALSIAAPAQAVTTLVSEDFTSGLGVFSATGQVGINTGNGYNSCCGTTGSVANMTNPFVAFGSNDLPSGTLSTPITLVGNESYTLSFDLGAFGAGSEQLIVSLGALTFTFAATANNNADTTFIHRTAVVFVTPPFEGPTTLQITSSGIQSVDSILDNFLLTTTAPPTDNGVPEPATWAMMLLGFGAIGTAMRRQRRLAAA